MFLVVFNKYQQHNVFLVLCVVVSTAPPRAIISPNTPWRTLIIHFLIIQLNIGKGGEQRTKSQFQAINLNKLIIE